MKKTIIAVVTLAAASLVQAADTTWTSQSWTPSSTGPTSWEGSSADKLIFNGTSGSNKNGDEWTNAQLFIQGTTGNSQESTITGGTLEFISQNPATNDANNTPGVGYNAVVLGGNSSLTIDVGTLLLGESVVDQTDKKGGDRGIRLSGSNNTLTIYADRIVSYTGDEFIHVRQGDGSSVAKIGSADRRIGYFEAHTGWGKDDYGVALLQANEGNKVFLYADEAVLDGSTNPNGGVIGSGGWGEVHVDANKLTINGNICGTYGKMSNADEKLTLSVRAGTLDMTRDINVGNKGDGNSNFDRNTSVVIEADVLNLKGNIKVDNNKRTESDAKGNNISAVNLTVNKTANITGTIIASRTDGTSTVTLGGAGDATASSGKYEVTGDGSSIVFKDSGSWVINEWKGTDGNLTASNSVKVDVNGAVQTTSTTLNDTSTLTLNDGAKITSTTLEGSGGTFLINTADEQVINITAISC